MTMGLLDIFFGIKFSCGRKVKHLVYKFQVFSLPNQHSNLTSNTTRLYYNLLQHEVKGTAQKYTAQRRKPSWASFSGIDSLWRWMCLFRNT